jgi:hypothetical protein
MFFIQFRKNISHNNPVFEGISEPEEIEHDYRATSYHLDL